MKQLFGTILFYLLLGQALADGYPGFSHSETRTYSFSYKTAESAGLQNYFLNEIARINYLNLYHTRYDVEFVQEFSINTHHNGQSYLQCRILPDRLDGDIYYKSFDLSDVLIPSHCSFRVSAYKDDVLIEEFSVTDAPVESPVELAFREQLSNEDALDINISDFRFNYREENKEIFAARIAAINNWMAFLELGKSFIGKAEKIDPDAGTNLLSTYMDIYDLNRFWHLLNEGTEAQDFEIPLEHLAALSEIKRILHSNVRRLNTLFERNADTLDVNFEDEYQFAAARLATLQIDYLNALENTHYYYGPVYQQAARFFTNPGDWDQMAREIVDVFNCDEQAASGFCKEVYRNYLGTADLFMKGENYTKALMILENAETLCAMMQGTDCGLELFKRLAQAKYGIYDAYLKVASSAMQNQNLEMAEKYLERAAHFQQENKSLILTAGDVHRLLEELAWSYYEQGLGLNESGRPEDALTSFTYAMDIYNRLGISNFKEGISREIEKLRR